MPTTQAVTDLVDGFWYWVRHDPGFGLEPIEAPARYQANVDCFYSWEFSGIPTRELVVLGPALRAQPADLTPDALLRRIQASPFRDDKALADLVKGLQDLRRAAEQIYQVRSLDSADVPLEENWPAEFEALGLVLKATASASTTGNTKP